MYGMIYSYLEILRPTKVKSNKLDEAKSYIYYH